MTATTDISTIPTQFKFNAPLRRSWWQWLPICNCSSLWQPYRISPFACIMFRWIDCAEQRKMQPQNDRINSHESKTKFCVSNVEFSPVAHTHTHFVTTALIVCLYGITVFDTFEVSNVNCKLCFANAVQRSQNIAIFDAELRIKCLKCSVDTFDPRAFFPTGQTTIGQINYLLLIHKNTYTRSNSNAINCWAWHCVSLCISFEFFSFAHSVRALKFACSMKLERNEPEI